MIVWHVQPSQPSFQGVVGIFSHAHDMNRVILETQALLSSIKALSLCYQGCRLRNCVQI